MIDKGAVVTALNAALQSYERIEVSSLPDWPGAQRPIITLNPKDSADFRAVLKAQADLEIFDDRMQQLGGIGTRVTLDQLAIWLIERALQVGSDQTVADLSRYVADQRFLVTEVVALSGIVPEQAFDLGDGIQLVPISNVPSCPQREMLLRKKSGADVTMSPSASAALLCQTRWPVNHSGTMAAISASRAADLEDARHVITAVGPSAPIRIIAWEIVPADVPLSNRSFGWTHQLGGGDSNPASFRGLTSDDLQTVRALRTFFASGTKREKDHLRVALDRLNRSLRGVVPVDKAIDLGICLEAIFLNEPEMTGELSFRLRVRASRYLATDAGERDRISDAMGVLYGLRSEAVHAGRFRRMVINGTPVATVLENGAQLAATAIRKMILEGLPDWQKVIHQ